MIQHKDLGYMYKANLIGVIFIAMLMSIADPSYGARTDCYIDTRNTDLWAFIGEGAEQPDKLLIINNIDDRRIISDIFKKLINKKSELENKIKEGDNLAEKYKKLKNAHDEEAKLEKRLQEQYDQLSYKEITQLRSEIQIRRDEMINIYDKGNLKRLPDVTKELKTITMDMAKLHKDLRNNIEEINIKQQGALSKNPLFEKVTEIRCEE